MFRVCHVVPNVRYICLTKFNQTHNENMTVQFTPTGQTVVVMDGSGNTYAKGNTTNPLRSTPVISNDGLMGSVTSGNFNYVYGPGPNTLLFKNFDTLIDTFEFATTAARDAAFTGIGTRLAAADAFCAVAANGTCT